MWYYRSYPTASGGPPVMKFVKHVSGSYLPVCARRVFRPDGKAIVTRGDLKITPPQNRQVILQVIRGTIH